MHGMGRFKARNGVCGWLDSKAQRELLAGEQLIPMLHMQVVRLHGSYMTLAADNGRAASSQSLARNFFLFFFF